MTPHAQVANEYVVWGGGAAAPRSTYLTAGWRSSPAPRRVAAAQGSGPAWSSWERVAAAAGEEEEAVAEEEAVQPLPLRQACRPLTLATAARPRRARTAPRRRA